MSYVEKWMNQPEIKAELGGMWKLFSSPRSDSNPDNSADTLPFLSLL
jgi:hypothetical protein